MAMDTSTEALANNAILTLVTRGVQLIGIPIGLWLLFGAGTDLANLKTDLSRLQGAFQSRVETAQLRERTQDDRISAVEGAIFRHP